MPLKFTVGELAKLHKIKKQTLIFYDKQGVFKPRIVDEHNGYRYYTADQLEVLDSVLMLREMGLSLAEIKEFMCDRTQDNALLMLLRQKSEIALKIKSLVQIGKRVDKKINTLDNLSVLKDIEIVKLDEEFILTAEVSKPNELVDSYIALKKLLIKASEDRLPHYYQTGVSVPMVELLKGNCVNADFVFLPLYGKTPRCDTRPKGSYLRTYYRGTYEGIEKGYRLLLDYAKAHNYSLAHRSYEYCILDSLTSTTEEEYLTQINIQIN